MLAIQEQRDAVRARLLSLIEGLNDEELNWKPSESSWSIAQVVQHIAIVESGISNNIAAGLSQEPNFVPSDIALEQLITDRSRKVNAPTPLHPTEEFRTLGELKEILQSSHNRFDEAISSIEDITLLDKTAPPRHHPVFGQLSTGQWIQAVPLHEQRHIEQIEEVKALLQGQ